MQKSFFTTLDYHPEIGRPLADVYAAAIEHACLADSLGFSGFWVAEHHFHNLGSLPNPAVFLASVAQCTGNIRLGPSISVLPWRTAIHTAEDYAMVDMLANGRLNMGVGMGNTEAEFIRAGVDFDARRAVFEERLIELKSCWSSPYDTSMDTLNVRPVQASIPRIYVSTNTPERAYRAGTEGDSVLSIVSPGAENLKGIEQVVLAHARGLAESKTDVTDAEVVVTAYACAAETEEAALEVAAVSIGRFMMAATGQAMPDPQAMCRQMTSRDAGLIGTKEQISRQLSRYNDIGVKHVSFLGSFGCMTSEQVKSSIELLAAA